MLLSFVGKGGVGKTTIASAVALSLTKLGTTALVSSDFMPSLKYLFPEVHKNLEVIEMQEKDIAEKWKQSYGGEVITVLRNLFEVEDWVLDHIAGSPGVAEEFLISNIVDLDLSKKYDYIIWDTAASSSTMHLILLQKEFYDHLSRDVRIYLKLRDVVHSDSILDLLEEWKRLAERVWKHLLSTRFFLVTTSDELSFVQAMEIEKDLGTMGIKVSGEIMNRCREDEGNSFLLSVPELKGSARDIVETIANLISDNKKVMDLIK
jgi:arsenite-transporting ATPase